jgi:hypothetical protein
MEATERRGVKPELSNSFEAKVVARELQVAEEG